ncbi:STAS domain-containing protein [Streptomyces sp. H39-S7]|uniref:STAS domain-containing protein n=1 Tax=Streptomyces sp. H39-S7 TaxID=3004357 RepID=UPI0022B03254|nr:STAS domain-containing protein [Streptomyces sp. H39-S7]MCZ4125050.1 STAS domain-containing protein [Streptomyces sp. H39-S7]
MESGDHTYEHLTEDITLVRVGGNELDEYTGPPLRELLVDLVNRGRFYMVVDLTTINYINSTGLGVLVGSLRRNRAHDGGLALVVPKESVLKVLRITGLIKRFPIFDTVDPAVEHLGRNGPKTHVGQ